MYTPVLFNLHPRQNAYVPSCICTKGKKKFVDTRLFADNVHRKEEHGMCVRNCIYYREKGARPDGSLDHNNINRLSFGTTGCCSRYKSRRRLRLCLSVTPKLYFRRDDVVGRVSKIIGHASVRCIYRCYYCYR